MQPVHRAWLLRKRGLEIACEVTPYGDAGAELRLIHDGKLAEVRRFDALIPAVTFALVEREARQREGWGAIAPELDRDFWHAIDPADGMFAHNLKIFRGLLVSMSRLRLTDPSMAGAVSPYEVFTRERPKEDSFETVRANEFSNCPSRFGALFLFGAEADADRANKDWWASKRVILPSRIVECSSFGEFDSKHLDRPPSDWLEAARSYWSGTRTAAPAMESLLCGAIQLTNWEPYGRFFQGFGDG